MEYVNYLKATGESEFIWMRDIDKASIRFPVKGSLETVEFDFVKTKRPILAVGNNSKFKQFLELSLLRNYHPRNMRIIEINNGLSTGTPLLDLSMNMRRVFADGSSQALISYLSMVNYELKRVLMLQTVKVHYVLILDSVLRTAKDNALVGSILEDICSLGEQYSNLTIVFLENEISESITEMSFLSNYVGFCFECARPTSTVVLGTDIAGTLTKNDIFYVKIDDEFVKCLIPTFEDNELDNILTLIIKSV